MNLQTLIFRYVFFAVIATLINLAVQRLILWFGDSNIIFAFALSSGTLMGLIVKYILDKRWIFKDMSTGAKEHSKKFSLYTLMGIATTAIFWGTETAFWLTWKTDMMRELGAIIGLSIGYIVKYHLDRRYVFTGSKLVKVL